MNRDELIEVLAEHDWHGSQPLHMDGVIFAHKCLCGFMWETTTELRGHMLDAILPLIEADVRERIATEIEAVNPSDFDTSRGNGVLGAFYLAARIARGADALYALLSADKDTE